MSSMRVLVDMDGVLANVYSQFLKLEAQETGRFRNIEETNGKIESEAFPFYDKHVRSAGFFGTAPIMKDSVEGVKYLNNKYEVIILSSATEFPISLSEKELWLNKFFPFIGWQQMVFCGRKDLIKGDIMIDDHPKNLLLFEGRKVLFTQPHNIYIHNTTFERVICWEDIIKLL